MPSDSTAELYFNLTQPFFSNPQALSQCETQCDEDQERWERCALLTEPEG